MPFSGFFHFYAGGRRAARARERGINALFGLFSFLCKWGLLVCIVIWSINALFGLFSFLYCISLIHTAAVLYQCPFRAFFISIFIYFYKNLYRNVSMPFSGFFHFYIMYIYDTTPLEGINALFGLFSFLLK